MEVAGRGLALRLNCVGSKLLRPSCSSTFILHPAVWHISKQPLHAARAIHTSHCRVAHAIPLSGLFHHGLHPVSSNCQLRFLISSSKRCLSSQSHATNKQQQPCWNCSSSVKVSELFCSSCSSLQEPRHNATYFDILDQPVSFDLDADKLTKKFRELQWQLHPDKFATRSQKEQDLSATHSSLVNKAYQTLLKPLERGLYLLELKGRPLGEETQVDNEFLLSIMEINEEIAETASKERLKEIRAENEEAMNKILDSVSVSFAKDDVEAARKKLIQLKYFVNIDQKLADLLQ